MTLDFTGLLVVAVVAFIAPIVARLVPRRLVPAVVIEVLLGLAVGPQGLGWVKPQGAVELLYLMGLGFLLFLAGQDIEPARFRDPRVRVTGAAYLVSLASPFPLPWGSSPFRPGLTFASSRSRSPRARSGSWCPCCGTQGRSTPTSVSLR